MNSDDYADDDTNPGLPACTIVGALLDPRLPGRLPYHLRYPPVIDRPVEIVVWPDGRLIPESLDDFGSDDVTGDHIAIGSRPIGDKK